MSRFLLVLFTIVWPLAARAATLEEVFAAIDKAAAEFRGLTASITRQDHTAVIDDTTKESGRITIAKSKSGDIRMLIEFTDPDVRVVAFADRKAQIYNPKIKTVDVYDLGKYKNLVDQFLLLGFGSSSAELKKNYSIRLAGTGQLAGETVSRLELAPKSAEAKQHLVKVELWISAAGYPLQQKFYRPSDDYTLVSYRDLAINPNLAPAALHLKLPPGVKRQFPGK